MAKAKQVFVCSQCGYESPRWMGKCPGCGAWNTMVEEVVQQAPARSAVPATHARAVRLRDVQMQEMARDSSGIGELDRVLGGGIVPGSMVLLGGDPGIGKSTLMLQMSHHMAEAGKRILYVSGEESPRQIRMRAQRLEARAEQIYLLAQTSVEAILAQIEETGPDVVLIDSIQTMMCGDITSAPGSVSQVRESTARLLRGAKENGYTVFLVGHVTKEGAIAGPRVLEHMVDTVLYFEGDRHHQYRILRAVKNRFGSTNEIGLFEMQSSGMVEIENPSSVLLRTHAAQAAGAAVVCSMEGTRPVLVEVQALVSTTSFGTPRRMASGFDHNRMALLLAVLEKKARLPLGNQDAYINVAGGLRLDEPAVDIGICAALASSLYSLSVPQGTVLVGEVGLTGEVRAVSQLERRLAECAKLGFTRCIVPREGLGRIKVPEGIEACGVGDVRGALEALFGKHPAL
nr:DNA repair protein RadA [Maliibacterium massiliense]